MGVEKSEIEVEGSTWWLPPGGPITGALEPLRIKEGFTSKTGYLYFSSPSCASTLAIEPKRAKPSSAGDITAKPENGGYGPESSAVSVIATR